MSKPKAPAFQFYASDFLGSMRVKLMDLEERGAYITLLAHAWDEEGLPDDGETIPGLLGLKPGSAKFKRIWKRVQRAWELHDGRWYNPRQERERIKVKAFSESQRERVNKRYRKDTAVEPGKKSGTTGPYYSPSPSPTPTPKPPLAGSEAAGVGGEPKAAAEVMAGVMAELKPRLVG